MTGFGDAASVASGVVTQFDLTQYVPQNIQDNYNTGKAYYDAFKKGVNAVTIQNGSVQLSDAAANTIGDTVLYTVEASVPVLGQALAVFMALYPKAGPGPGTCASQPPVVADPAHPKPSELAQWQYYTPWQKMFGNYDLGDTASFEAYANVALQWNWELDANCFQSLFGPPQVILAGLIASWNATHAGPTRTVTRSGLNKSGWGLAPGYDPIANALEAAVVAKYAKNTQGESWSDYQSQVSQAPSDVTSSFVINDGPEIAPGSSAGPRVIHLTLTNGQTTAVSTPASMSTGSKVALSVAIVGGTAAAGVGVWAFVTHQGYGEAWSRVWRKSGGRILRKG
jgi:hypothetical protein